MLNTFAQQRELFFEEFGKHKKMVLSTSFQNQVTSRMMSWERYIPLSARRDYERLKERKPDYLYTIKPEEDI